MEQVIKYFLRSCFLILILSGTWDVYAVIYPLRFSYTNPPDTIASGDTSKVDLPYPLEGETYPFDGYESTGGIFLNDPQNIKTTIEYDPVNNEYIFYKKIGDFYYRVPNTMSFEEYLKYDMDKSLKNYFQERSKASGMDGKKGLIPEFRIGSEIFDRIFGSNTIDIRPQGSAELTFGIIANNRADPTLDVRQRRTVNFDFKQKIQMSVMAKIGDKIEFNTNYNTEATFDFDNKLKLKYEGKEDEIIKLIEAGDVTLPLTSTLIRGSQSLFGIKTKLQFGRTTVTTVFSQQKSESSNITVEGGATTNTFEFSVDQYEENKHFFLSQYAREHYNSSLSTLPLVNSPITITKIEVWRTTIGAATTDNRNIVAFMDLGEYNPYRSDVISPTPGAKQIPSNYTNDLLSQLDFNQIRNINTVSNYLKGTFDFVSGIDFEKVENARKLNPSEYTFNSKLGFISLNTSLNSDQVLAVAFQYTVIGDDSIYQVGEFSDEGIESPNCIVVKLLRSTSINTRIPLWDLMMKNVYSIGAYQVNSEDFVLNILYSGGEEGVPTGYITEGDIAGVPLIRALNLDNLDQQLNPPYDGMFDFIDGAARQGGTIEASNGRIYFTLLEPFGEDLRKAIGDPAIADKYAYDSLYSMTKTGAQQYPDKNKFLLEGFYKSASGSEISLNAMNVPQGSVKVTAGGIVLTENVDYTVDYTLGRVRIINEGILNSGTPINISLESNTLFNIQTRRMMGAHVDYLANPNLNLGATILNLHERPLTQKVNYGDEPISNTIWGMDFAYQKESRFITKAIDKLPFFSTKAPSRVTIDGEFAHFIPGHSKAVGKAGTSYIDDFEGSKSTIDLKNISRWFIASTPQGQTDPGMFPEAALGTGLAYGYNRAKLAWYVIDPLFYDNTGNLKPPNIDNNELSKHSVRVVPETEVFPNKEPDNGIPLDIPVFNLAYYPDERGPYNYDTKETDVSKGIDADGNLNNPASRWGGIMRKIETTDFEATNVEYIEFWMMDPFADNPNSSGGQLYFNLGDISEDILRDSRKSYEDGLPTSEVVENVDTTIWGRVPTLQSLVGAFDNDPASRPYQDVGYDGLRNADEQSFFANFLTEVGAIVNLPAYDEFEKDPSGDNYHYFRGNDYDNDPKYSSILERYKNFNGPDGNSPTSDQNPNGENYPTLATTLPNVEDINDDNTLSEDERYFQYVINLRPQDMIVGENYIADVYHAKGIPLANGNTGDVKWYQFKIPVSSPDRVVGEIQDFKSIRFIRMFLKGFSERVVCRFATLELVRGEWRKYKYDLLSPGEYIPTDENSLTTFDISTVSIEENGQRVPIPYVLPPGIEREINLGTTNLQQLNEQSIELRVCDLIDGDARAAYKTTEFDIRLYKKLKMYVHAEKGREYEDIENGDLTVFIRLGADFKENFYEYEVPLVFTPWGTSASNAEAIWPYQNEFIIELKKFVEAKLFRNRTGNSVYQDGRNTITVIGNPNLSNIKAIMLGVRNPKQNSITGTDDGKPKCAIIWLNELRLTDFDNQGGFATTARANINLADLGNLVMSGTYSTPGFGALEEKVNERQMEYTASYDIATNLELGKFFPEKLGLRIPMHVDHSETRITPKYNPLDPDVLYQDAVKSLNQAQKDSLKKVTQDVTKRTNINFINVRKENVGEMKKPRFYHIENFDVSFSYSKLFHRDVDIEYDEKKTYKGGLGYNFTNNPKSIRPFSKVKFLSGKAFQLIRDFNFYAAPKLISFRTDMHREYREKKLRSKSRALVIIEPSYLKKWDWSRIFDIKYDLTQSLRVEYQINSNSYIDEPAGRIDKDDPDYKAKRDTIWNEILSMGTMKTYSHNFNANYNIPINKIPLLNWLTASARYSSTYNWTASPKSIQSTIANTIDNSNTIQLTGNINLSSLYNNIGYLKKLDSKGGGQRSRRSQPPQKTQSDDAADDSGTKTKSDSDTTTTAEEEKDRINYLKIIGESVVKVLIGLKTASLSYTEGNGTTLPGFIPEPGAIGNNWQLNAPGLGFLFGSQRDIRQEAVEKGWLTTDTSLNTAYMTKLTQNLTARATYEPFRGFRIEFTANRNYSENFQEYFVADASGEFKSSAPMRTGSFSISTITMNTAFGKSGDDVKSDIFEAMKSNRILIANRLGARNPWSQGIVDSTGFPDGYGPGSQDVLLYSFISAYTGTSPDKIKLKTFPAIPLPNWRITFDGLMQIEFVKKYLRNITLSHAYRSTYNVGSFTTNMQYDELDGFAYTRYAGNNNFIPAQEIATVSINEQFSPLFNIDMTWNNSLMSKVEYKKTRNLSFSFVNNQLTEVISNEFIIGLGYRIKDVEFIIRTLGGGGKRTQMSSDLNIKADFSIRTNKTTLRRIDEDINQISSGQKVMTINTSVDYMINQNFNVRLFFDRVVNNPFISSQFRIATTNAGISLRFTLTQ